MQKKAKKEKKEEGDAGKKRRARRSRKRKEEMESLGEFIDLEGTIAGNEERRIFHVCLNVNA